MPQNPKRRLAAILFADIVGYTALMQRNEQEGLATVHRFSEVMEMQAKTHQGEILEFRGDGCLVVFDSAVEAVHAAKAIQEQLREPLAVPLRIGIHLGDIVFTQGNIYGDGVNLASRVESMGVPGSILVTERVIHDVKSHPEFEMKSLGQFQFKNVEKPMEVFAVANEGLTVPRPEEMSGKGERVLDRKPRMKSVIRLASMGFVAMTIGAVLFWVLGSQRAGNTNLLGEEIREEKVAVSVFENFTGDENLDALGYLGSEWISSGLRELEIRTVSPEMVRQNKDQIGILPNNPQNEPSFAEITGAKFVITGSYYLQKDSILLNTRLSSTETGEEVYNFPKLMGHKDQKEALVEEARQYLLGYWVLKKNQKLPNLSPPKYEAYQIYLTCMLNQPDCYQKVLAIDPDLMLARVWFMYVSGLRGDDSTYLANQKYVEERWGQCTEFERNIFLFSSGMWEGDFQAASDALEANYQLDSADLFIIHESAYILLTAINQPEKAVKRFQRIFEKISLFERKVPYNSYALYMRSLNRSGAFQEASNFFASLSDSQRKEHGSHLINPLIKSFIHQNRIEEVKQVIAQWGNRNQDHVRAAYYFSYLYPETTENPFADGLRKKMTIPWKNSGNRLNMASMTHAHFVLKEWEAATDSLLSLKRRNDNQPVPSPRLEGEIEAMLGSIYAHQGKREEALIQLEKIKQLGAQYFDQSLAIKGRGRTPYLMARIYAVLGEKAKAVEMLQLSRDQGGFNLAGRLDMNLDFVNLKGYPPYEELIRPKG